MCGNAGPSFTPAVRLGVEQASHKGPWRREVLDPPQPPAIVSTGRVAEHPDAWTHELVGDIIRVGADHVRAITQVRLRDYRRHRVDLHRDHLEARSSESQGVGADAAADVDHAVHSGLHKPTGVVIGDLGPGGLLKTVSGEEHRQGVVTELGRSAQAQRGLGECSRRQLRAIQLTHPRGCSQRLGIGFRHCCVERIFGQAEGQLGHDDSLAA